jgi:prepilin-type processing-associated H-X9-DG protein
LIELLVVVSIIALLMAILLPSLSSARQRAQAAVCLSNLRQCGTGTLMYAADWTNTLPYPVSSPGESYLWYNAIDAYLSTLEPSGSRAYVRFKNDPVWPSLPTNPAVPLATTQSIQQFSRTYKMNTRIRRPNVTWTIPSGLSGQNAGTYKGMARTSDIDQPSEFVLYGDSRSYDVIPQVINEIGRFSFDVNHPSNTDSDAGIALRHRGGAQMSFADGHAGLFILPTISTAVTGTTPSLTLPRWPTEFTTGGTEVQLSEGTALPAGAGKNPKLPMEWTVPGVLY